MSEDDDFTAPCGCRFMTVGTTFMLESCDAAEDCEWVQYMMRMAEELDKPTAVLDMRDDST